MDVKNLGILPIDESLYNSSYTNSWAHKFSANARSFWSSAGTSAFNTNSITNPLNAVAVASTPSTTNSSLTTNHNSLINPNASNANLNTSNMMSNTFNTTNNLMNGLASNHFFNTNYPYSSANTSGLNSGLNSSFSAASLTTNLQNSLTNDTTSTALTNGALSSMKSLSQLASTTEKFPTAKAN